MKKRCAVFIIIIILIFQLPANVSAVGNKEKKVSVVSSYCIENKLYTFVKMGGLFGKNPQETKVMRVENGTATGKGVQPVPFRKSSSIARYLFMVDLSGSMRGHIKEINAFVRSVMDAEGQSAVYTVASFGERFEVVSKDQTDKNTVMKVLDGLDYNEQLTNPYTAVENALQYLDSCPIRGGDLVNLILISDGEPDLGYQDKDREAKEEAKAAKKAGKRVAAATDIVFHTVVLSDEESNSFSSFAKGTGKNITVGSVSQGKKAGKGIVSFADRLHLVSLPLYEVLDEDLISIDLLFSRDSDSGKSVMVNKTLPFVKVLKGFSSSQEAPKASDIPKEDDDRQEADSIKSDVAHEKNNTGKKVSGLQKNILIISLSVAAILLCACIFIIICRKKKKRGKTKTAAAEDSIFMKLEVISGQCNHLEMDFHLSDCIIIGSDSACDLIFNEKDVSRQNTKVYRKDDMIFIEDLNSKNGTVLEGMRLHTASRLRSGDEISIGSVRFKFKF